MDVIDNYLLVSWDRKKVDIKYGKWAEQIPIKPPYDFPIFWDLDQLKRRFVQKMGVATLVCPYRKIGNNVVFGEMMKLSKPNPDKFILALVSGKIVLDLDIRTNCDMAKNRYHDHGPHFRCQPETFHSLFDAKVADSLV